MNKSYKALNFIASIYTAILVILMTVSISIFFSLNDKDRNIEVLEEQKEKVKNLNEINYYLINYFKGGYYYRSGDPTNKTVVMTNLNEQLDMLKRFIKETDLSDRDNINLLDKNIDEISSIDQWESGQERPIPHLQYYVEEKIKNVHKKVKDYYTSLDGRIPSGKTYHEMSLFEIGTTLNVIDPDSHYKIFYIYEYDLNHPNKQYKHLFQIIRLKWSSILIHPS